MRNLIYSIFLYIILGFAFCEIEHSKLSYLIHSWSYYSFIILDPFLCRKCGLEVVDIDEENFFNLTSPQNLGVFKFSDSPAFIQKLRNPSGVFFELFTVKSASCKGIGDVRGLNS